MDYKLIALDMDETLLNHKKQITTENKTAISQALEKGIKVVLTSGRSHDGMAYCAKELGIEGPDQYMITNGGDTIEKTTGELIFKKTLENRFCHQISDFLVSKKIKFILIDTTGATYDSYQEWLEKRMLEPELEIVKVLMHIKKHNFEEVAQLIHQTYDEDFFVVKTGAEYLEIFPKDINKGTAVRRLAKHLKIDMKQVIAMGDMDNDIPMIKLAGMGVAMENAEPEVKEASNFITKDCNHSGVGFAIEKFAL